MAFTEGLSIVYRHQKLQFDEFVDFLVAKKCQGAKVYRCGGRRDGWIMTEYCTSPTQLNHSREVEIVTMWPVLWDENY